jgi:hypothetical protein
VLLPLSSGRIHALESKGSDDDTKWLTYWVVYAFFGLFEFFSDLILGWFPFYWLAKVAFLVWCFNPLTNGSLVVYNRLIRPVFLRNQSKIDGAVNAATGAVLNQGKHLHELTVTVVSQIGVSQKDDRRPQPLLCFSCTHEQDAAITHLHDS